MNRNRLIGSLREMVYSRQHVHMPATTSAVAKTESARDDLDANLERLGIADLWTMQLVCEMLTRPRIQAAIRVMALKDREDTRCAWGGLAGYRDGGADAMLYSASPDVPANDLVYTPPPKAISEARESLFVFVGHFEKEANASRAGPTADELKMIKDLDLPGVIFTSISADRFCAHYVSTGGLVISLGCYPLLEWKQ